MSAPLVPSLPSKSAPSPHTSFFPKRQAQSTDANESPYPKMDQLSLQDGEAGYLFLGLDCSTQGLKAVAVDEGLAVFAEFNVNFDRDLPSFKTESGVLLEEGGVVNSPVAMYLEALDLLMEKMKAGNFPFDRVASISGAGQQHAMILFSKESGKLLSSLDSNNTLADQLAGAFSSPTVTNWQDSSTRPECKTLEASLEGGRAEMAQTTGSRCHTRFTGPQILKVVGRGEPTVWKNTSAITLVSNWLATMFCADGEIKGVDEADACGENLFDIPKRDWNPTLLKAASKSDDPNVLGAILGKVELDPSRAVGTVGNWWVERWGFDPTCIVCPFTGDNPSTLLSFSLSPGDAIVSLGTSDTVLLATDFYAPDADWHTFAHPAGDTPEGKRRYMGMLCYKNGSLSRERIQKTYNSANWDEFNASVKATPLPTSSSSKLATFNFDKPEIIPSGVKGIHVFRNGERLESGEKDLSDSEKKELARRCLESQFLSFRSRIRGILRGGELRRVFVAGGGSVNSTITGLLSDVLGCPVYVAEGSAQGCAIGASYRAAWAYKKTSDSSIGFEQTVKQAKAVASGRKPKSPSKVTGPESIEGMKLVASPDKKTYDAYGEYLPSWEKLEEVVVEVCAGATA